MPYVKEYEDGTLVGALSKSLADRLIADLAERSPGRVKKARQFHPDDPSRVVTGTRPSYPARTIESAALDSYFRAVEQLRAAFVQAEGRQPTADDVNYTSALDELYEQHAKRTSRWAPVEKSRGGSPIQKAMRGERAVMGESDISRAAAERPIRKRRGGLASSAMRGATGAVVPNSRVVLGGR
jgi:hypothetical protein